MLDTLLKIFMHSISSQSSLSHSHHLSIYPLYKLRQPIRSVSYLTGVFNHCMLITVQCHCGSEWLPSCIPACAIYCFLQLYVAAPFVHNSFLSMACLFMQAWTTTFIGIICNIVTFHVRKWLYNYSICVSVYIR